jgi:hypothetical protein
MRPASNCACANGCREFFNVDCSALVISEGMRATVDCAFASGTIIEAAATSAHTKWNFGFESATIVFIAIPYQIEGG